MPIYEFSCQHCKGRVELLVKNTRDEIEIRCPDCGSSELQRVVSRVNSIMSEGTGCRGSTNTPSVEDRSCPSGTCTTMTLPGHSRSS